MPKNEKPTERRDDRNFARLGIISMLTRVDTVTEWLAEFTVGDRHHRIRCVSPQGRPHGIDTDVVLALQTLFVRQGCPEHNWVHTTAYELRELSGLAQNGLNYQRIRESLTRLATCTFFVSEGLQDLGKRRKWDTELMRYIEGMRFRETDDDLNLPGLDESSTLSIRLGMHLAESIRAGHTQVLDGQLLLQLEQPTARALCRLLESHRLQGDGSRLMHLQVSLEDWRQACGITSDRPDMVRRTLAPAHDELIAAKYLHSVDIEGRGKKQTLTYHFQSADAPDPALVATLRDHGFTANAALEVTRLYGDRVEEAVHWAKHRKSSGYQIKNLPGLIVDYLKDPEKYGPVVEAEPASPPAADRVKVAVQQEEDLARRQFEQEQAQLKALSPEQQYQESKAALNLLLKKHLSKEELKLLEQACLAGRIMAAELKEAVTLATGRLTLGEFIEDLRSRLQG